MKTVKAGTDLDLDCGYNTPTLQDMMSQVKAVEQKLMIDSSEQINDTLQIESSDYEYDYYYDYVFVPEEINDNLTKEELQTAGKMFLYLITCPDTIKPWIVFYKYLFQTQSPDKIILTLNRLMKGEKTAFTKIAKTLSQSMKMKMFSGTAVKNSASQVGNSNDEYLVMDHPVHIMTKDHKMSPSAFIPFCDFGGNMSAMGVMIDQFNFPVCNSFQAKIMNDQLCYEVDLNKFSDKNNIQRELELGFNFLMDYNEDRQVTLDKNISRMEVGLANNMAASDQSQHAFIYLNTIGELL